MVKISIIIPSYNQGRFIEDAIRSIIDQNYPNVEIIVMDGGSTDNTVDVIKQYSSYITYWKSERDKGQSDAINKGVLLSTGDIVTWLNSDDVLLWNTLNLVNKYAEEHPEIQWFLGNVLWLDRCGKIIKVGRVENESHFWNSRHIFSNGGPSAFMRRDTLIKIGLLREDFHYMMDTELWHRYLKSGYGFKRIRSYCWGLRLHENAKMSGHNFANSVLADKSHPSWSIKARESELIREWYPRNRFLTNIWKCCKLFSYTYFSRYTERMMKGKNYSSVKDK